MPDPIFCRGQLVRVIRQVEPLSAPRGLYCVRRVCRPDRANRVRYLVRRGAERYSFLVFQEQLLGVVQQTAPAPAAPEPLTELDALAPLWPAYKA